jgi:hypothetical protein
MPTRRATRRQRGGFLDWLFGSNAATSPNAEKKNTYATNAAPANAPVYANAAPVGGRRSRKARKSRKVRKARKGSRRH